MPLTQRLFMSTVTLIVALLLMAGTAAPLVLLLPDIGHVTGLLLVCVAGLLTTALHAIWSGRHGARGSDRVYCMLGWAMMVSGAMIAVSNTPASLGACYLGAGVAILSGVGKVRRKRPVWLGDIAVSPGYLLYWFDIRIAEILELVTTSLTATAPTPEAPGVCPR